MTEKQYRVRIEQDEYPDSPADWGWGIFGVCNPSTRRFAGNEHPFGEGDVSYRDARNLDLTEDGKLPDDLEPEEIEEIKLRNVEIELEYHVFPLYMYSHSGEAISIRPFGCRWDSGQIGWCFVPCKDRETREAAQKAAEAWIQAWNQYLSGDVWEVIAEVGETCSLGHVHWEPIPDETFGAIYGRQAAEEEKARILADLEKEVA